MAAFGLALLGLVGVGLLVTGWPAFVVLIGAAMIGAAASALSGDTGHLSAIPSRLVALLENDLLQALPLFVLTGALLNRLPLVSTLFRTAAGLLGGGRAASRVSALGIGALLAPLCGSVGASVAMLSRAVAPRLRERGAEPDEAFAAVAVASTLGVVVPPSLVLILLGDALLGAHTLALNLSGRSGRVLNTADVFSAALGPAAVLIGLVLAVAAWPRRSDRTAAAGLERPSSADLAVSVGTLIFVLGLLAGVASGVFYAVEAAAAAGGLLLAGGLASRRLSLQSLGSALEETLAVTGALFALLVAATTFTLVLRGLGSDRLLLELVASLPAGDRGATLAVMAALAATALALDAFEIIFVVVPLLLPGLLVRVEDAHWVAALTLLTLQTSFLLPPLGYAVTMARARVAPGEPGGILLRALAPYLVASAGVLALTFALPALTHLGEKAPTIGDQGLSADEVNERLNRLAPELPPPPPVFRPD